LFGSVAAAKGPRCGQTMTDDGVTFTIPYFRFFVRDSYGMP
jgi:hypothetical protein